ncbi:MAG: hypothetical protein RLZZ244_2146 [Verrucomicrobiota bacterium]|jgi:hypothetical protein
MASVASVSAVSKTKAAAQKIEPPVSDYEKMFAKRLSALSQSVSSGKLQDARKAYVKLTETAADLSASDTKGKGDAAQLRKSVSAVGAALRSNTDTQATQNAVEKVKKQFEARLDAGRVQSENVQKDAHNQMGNIRPAKESPLTGGVNASNSDAYRSLFNEIA